MTTFYVQKDLNGEKSARDSGNKFRRTSDDDGDDSDSKVMDIDK